MSARPGRPRRNGSVQRARKSGSGRTRPGRGMLLAPILGATVIVSLAWGASLEQATPEMFVAASLVFAIMEGIVLAFVGAAWGSRGLVWSAAVAVLTALLSLPGRWELAYLRTGQQLHPIDLAEDAAVTVAWAAFAGLAGATILRERLRALTPNR